MDTAIKHPAPDQFKPSFVIFDIWALWRSVLSVRVPGCQKLQILRYSQPTMVHSTLCKTTRDENFFTARAFPLARLPGGCHRISKKMRTPKTRQPSAVAYLECAKGGAQGVWGRKSPVGSRGKASVGGLGGFCYWMPKFWCFRRKN